MLYDLHGGAEVSEVYVIHFGTGVHVSICCGGEQWLPGLPDLYLQEKGADLMHISRNKIVY